MFWVKTVREIGVVQCIFSCLWEAEVCDEMQSGAASGRCSYVRVWYIVTTMELAYSFHFLNQWYFIHKRLREKRQSYFIECGLNGMQFPFLNFHSGSNIRL